jgi:hypothetical protein
MHAHALRCVTGTSALREEQIRFFAATRGTFLPVVTDSPHAPAPKVKGQQSCNYARVIVGTGDILSRGGTKSVFRAIARVSCGSAEIPTPDPRRRTDHRGGSEQSDHRESATRTRRGRDRRRRRSRCRHFRRSRRRTRWCIRGTRGWCCPRPPRRCRRGRGCWRKGDARFGGTTQRRRETRSR